MAMQVVPQQWLAYTTAPQVDPIDSQLDLEAPFAAMPPGSATAEGRPKRPNRGGKCSVRPGRRAAAGLATAAWPSSA